MSTSKRRLAVILACFCAVFTSFGIRHSYGLLLPEMLPSLAISKFEAGLIYSSYFITYTVFSPVLGLLADRIDARKLLTLFSVILGTGAFLMAYSSSVIEASLFFALAGIGASAFWSPVVALAQRWVSYKRKGITLALIDMGSSLGTVIISAAMPLVVVAYSWRMGWVGLGILACLLVVINFFLVRSHPVDKSRLQNTNIAGYTSEPVKTTYMKFLRDIKFWLIGLSYLFIAISALIPFTFLSTYAVQEVRLPYEIAARLITLMAAAALIGKLVLGTLSDALGRIRVMILCGVLIAVGSFGMAYLQGLLALSLFAVIFGLGQGAVWSIYAACASDYFPVGSTGSVVGLWTLLMGIGSIFSPMIAGWTADATGTFTWSFILAMASAIVSSFLLLPLEKAFSSGGLLKKSG